LEKGVRALRKTWFIIEVLQAQPLKGNCWEGTAGTWGREAGNYLVRKGGNGLQLGEGRKQELMDGEEAEKEAEGGRRGETRGDRSFEGE